MGQPKPFNKLSPAELERLALLSEELGEAQQAIGKILRHGYKSVHPYGGLNNRENLEIELGDVQAAIGMMTGARDLRADQIADWAECKRERVQQYLHHQSRAKP